MVGFNLRQLSHLAFLEERSGAFRLCLTTGSAFRAILLELFHGIEGCQLFKGRFHGMHRMEKNTGKYRKRSSA